MRISPLQQLADLCCCTCFLLDRFHRPSQQSQQLLSPTDMMAPMVSEVGAAPLPCPALLSDSQWCEASDADVGS